MEGGSGGSGRGDVVGVAVMGGGGGDGGMVSAHCW